MNGKAPGFARPELELSGKAPESARPEIWLSGKAPASARPEVQLNGEAPTTARPEMRASRNLGREGPARFALKFRRFPLSQSSIPFSRESGRDDSGGSGSKSGKGRLSPGAGRADSHPGTLPATRSAAPPADRSGWRAGRAGSKFYGYLTGYIVLTAPFEVAVMAMATPFTEVQPFWLSHPVCCWKPTTAR